MVNSFLILLMKIVVGILRQVCSVLLSPVFKSSDVYQIIVLLSFVHIKTWAVT